MTAQHMAKDARRVMVLAPSAFDGRGPAATCANLLDGFVTAGREVHLFANRFRPEGPRYPVTRAIPRFANRFPYSMVRHRAGPVTERRFLAALRPGDVAHLWPDASLELHRHLGDRGVLVVQEAINSRMAHARALLDAAYDRLGLPPSHGITQARIDEEEEKYALSDAIFCPAPMTETALNGSGLALRRLRTSYGARYRPDLTHERPDPGPAGRVVFLFVGLGGIRKGIDRLLAAWPLMARNHVLRIVGTFEPEVRRLFVRALALPNVEAPGYSRDVAAEMARADAFVFLSVEEGGPQVTYEAANAGLPIVATHAGGGRFLEEQDCAVDATDMGKDALADTLSGIGRSREERMERGRAARLAAPRYDWAAIAARRSEALARDLIGAGAGSRRDQVPEVSSAAIARAMGAASAADMPGRSLGS